MASFIPPLDFSSSPSVFVKHDIAVDSYSETLSAELEHTGLKEFAPLDPFVDDSERHDSAISTSLLEQPSPRTPVKGRKHKKLVKRSATITSSPSSAQSPAKPTKRTESRRSSRTPAREAPPSREGVWYRCDIHSPNSVDHLAAEAESRNVICLAGGKVLEDTLYPGGLLFHMPKGTSSPLLSGDETSAGGHIALTPFTPFPAPVFNGLKLKAYGEKDFLLLPVPAHCSSAGQETRPKSVGSVKGKGISARLGEWARGYGGGSVAYLA